MFLIAGVDNHQREDSADRLDILKPLLLTGPDALHDAAPVPRLACLGLQSCPALLRPALGRPQRATQHTQLHSLQKEDEESHASARVGDGKGIMGGTKR